VIYRYKDAPNWSGPVKTIEKVVPAGGLTFQANLPETKKLPQMQDLTLRCGKLNWVPAKKVSPNKVVFDFSPPQSVQPWTLKSGPPVVLTHDGEGMVISVGEKAQFPQIRTAPEFTDWSEYLNVVVEADNLGPKDQTLILRVRSGESNDQRSDIELIAKKGRNVLRASLAALKKTKLKAVDQVYIMTHQVPEEGCKVRIRKIYLEPKKDM